MLARRLEPFGRTLARILQVPVGVLGGPPIRSVFLEAGVASFVELRPVFFVMVLTIMLNFVLLLIV